MSAKIFDPNAYYQRIMDLNLAHYAKEISYYIEAEPRLTEKAIARELKLKNIKSILDLCCGSGRLSFFLAQNGFGVTGLDICPAAIRAASEKGRQLGLSHLTFLVGDATKLPFANDTFEATICPRYSINAIPLYEKRLLAFQEMVRVTKPNGLIYVESFNYFYLGQKGRLFLGNLWRDFKKLTRWCKCFLINQPYQDLLFGDITYKANKVKGSPEGYTHLISYFELKRLTNDLKKIGVKDIELHSSCEICGESDWPILKFFRYAIWLKIKKEARLH